MANLAKSRFACAAPFGLRLGCALLAPASRAAFAAVCLAAVPGLAAAQGIGDPTRPTSLSEPEPVEQQVERGPRWRLQSTLVADNRRLAVINGHTVALGARVDGARLLEVRRDGVTLEEGGQRIDLRLSGTEDPKRIGGTGEAEPGNEGVPGNE